MRIVETGTITPLIGVARVHASPIRVAAEDRVIDVSRVVPWPTLFVAPGLASNREPTSGSAGMTFGGHTVCVV